jgi:hypothetical protein
MGERFLPVIQAPAPAADAHPSAAAQWPDIVARVRSMAARRPQDAGADAEASGREPAERRSESAARERGSAASACEFCSAQIEETHGHIVDLGRRAILCVCRPCYLLFDHDGAGGSRFRAIPDRYGLVPELAASRELWDALQIPIGLAFFFVNGSTGRPAAFYPSPAGATESELPLDAWEEIARAVPALGRLLPDVEALLVRRTDSLAEAVTVPIDVCYELVGRIRRSWQGFQGGDEVWQEIDALFGRAIARASGAAA